MEPFVIDVDEYVLLRAFMLSQTRLLRMGPMERLAEVGQLVRDCGRKP